MTNLDSARAMRDRLEEFDRRKKRRNGYASRRRTSAAEARVRVAALRARADDHPLGSIARPLPMLDPLAESRAQARRNRERIERAMNPYGRG